MTTTTIRDLSDSQKVIEFLEEVLGEIGCENFIDYADQYGEPGYNVDTDALTPMVILGSYWCRCADYKDERWPDSPLHSIWVHHEAEVELLEEQGVEFEWYDEWTVVHEYVDNQYVSNAYRTTSDSYHWQPSAILDEDCEWMTPHTEDEVWMEWAVNNVDRCLPDRMLTAGDPTGIYAEDGEQQWFPFREFGDDPDFPTTYSNGWHPGQDDTPQAVVEKIHARHGEDADFVFVLSETSQFYLRFEAYYRLPVDN